jgi:hypothetical protein
MMFREIIAIYYENHAEHKNTLHGQNIIHEYAKARGTYCNHGALKINTG